MITTPAEALALLRSAGVISVVPVPGLRSIVVEVTGGPVAGSWWGHPQGGLIFGLCEALGESGEALVGNFARGKLAFVHRALWPALHRVVNDAARVRAARGALPAEAEALLAELEAEGRLRLEGPRKASKPAAALLEKRLLARAVSEHTERGHHARVLTPWSAWAPEGVPEAAAALAYEAARDDLLAAGLTLG